MTGRPKLPLRFRLLGLLPLVGGSFIVFVAIMLERQPESRLASQFISRFGGIAGIFMMPVVYDFAGTAFVFAGLGIVLGFRRALPASAVVAAMYSGLWWFGALWMPWRSGMLVEIACLLVLMGAPFLPGGTVLGGRIGMWSVAAVCGLWIAVLGIYALAIHSVSNPALRALSPQPLEGLAGESLGVRPRCQMVREIRICLPHTYRRMSVTDKRKSSLGKNFADWRGPRHALFTLTDYTIAQSAHRRLGFGYAFALEQAMWHTHVHPGILLVFKAMLLDGNPQPKVHAWVSPKPRGFLIVRSSGKKQGWIATANVYPTVGSSYSLSSVALDRRQALVPVLTSLSANPK